MGITSRLRRLFGVQAADSSTPHEPGDLSTLSFAVVDTETTGVYQHVDRIIEIALLKITRDGKVLNSFETLVNPSRDLGPTHLHGITAAEISHAPSFAEVADYVLAAMSGSVIVAHNARFDVGLLRSEYARLGIEFPQMPLLCTLQLASHLGIPGRKLWDCCSAVGISPVSQHSAGGDVRATAELFVRLINRAGCKTLADLGCRELPLSCEPAPKPGLCPRQSAARAVNHERGYLSRLIAQMPRSPGHPVSDVDLHCYLDVVDRILEDRKVVPEEADDLMKLAREFGMTQCEVERAHTIYFKALCNAAVEHGSVGQSEHSDLELVSELLGVDKSLIPSSTSTAVTPSSALAVPAYAFQEDLRGKTVCFTGQSHLNGRPIPRTSLENIAREAGLIVLPSVTHQLDLLVAADPESLSGKARKAREYGVRILAESVLWEKLGISEAEVASGAGLSNPLNQMSDVPKTG
jgi:DNA polymerase III epsilon subunit-like protein